jgi:hypothetical protein
MSRIASAPQSQMIWVGASFVEKRLIAVFVYRYFARHAKYRYT